MFTVAVVVTALTPFIAVGTAGLYLAHSDGPTPEPYRLTALTAEERTPIDPAALDGSWTVRPATSSGLGFRAEQRVMRTVSPNTVVGRTEALTGTAQVHQGSIVAASFQADLSRLETNNDRQNALIRQALNTDTHREGAFHLTLPVSIPTSGGTAVSVFAHGDLTLHGVTKPVTIPLQVQLLPGPELQAELVGDISVDLSDFGVAVPSIYGISVDDGVKVELRTVLVHT